MPDESCRKCGGMLKEYTICAECRSANQFICKSCHLRTEIQFHDGYCFDKTDYTKTVLRHTVLPKIIVK